MKKLITILSLAFYLNINAQIIKTIAGDSTGGYNGDGGLAISGQLNNPYGIATDKYRNLYIADMANSRIRMVTQSTGVLSTIAGNGTFGYTGDGGQAVSAQLSSPYGIAVDANRNVYIADYDNLVVRQIITSTGIINTVAGGGSSGLGDNGPATSAQLSGPMGIAVDASGNLYIADYNYHRIRMVNPSGIITTIAGNGTQGFSGDGGPANSNSVQLNNPTGVAIDALGNIYISDYGNNRVRVIAKSSGNISTVAGNGTPGYKGNGGQAASDSSELFHPWNITTGSGNLYIADYGNQVIRKVNSLGVISTIAGNGTQGYTGDCGAPTAAELNYPAGLALDSYGNLYVADNGNNRIREILFSAGQTHVTGHATSYAICSGSTVVFTGGGASSYTWTNGVVNATPYTLPSVTSQTTVPYTVMGTDTNGCTNSAVVTVTVNPLPILIAPSITICSGQYATLIASSSDTTTHQFVWTNGISNGVPFMTTTTSEYIVTGTNKNGCKGTATATVTVLLVSPTFTLPVITISSNPITSCGNSGTLTASGASTYTWSAGQNGATIVVTPTISTTYTVSGTQSGCTVTNTVTQVVDIIKISSNIDTICSGSSAILTASGANTYTWSASNHTSTYTVSPTVSTTYSVTGAASVGTTTAQCVSSSSYTQLVRALSISSSADSLCNGSSAVLTATGASTFTWSTSQNAASISVSPTVSTTYSVSGIAQTCTVNGTFNQIVKLPLVISVTSSADSICVGGIVTLTASGANSYIWNATSNPQTGNSIVVAPTVSSTYSVTGIYFGCAANDTIRQKVDTACFAGIKQMTNLDNQIKIYPNPAANGSFTVLLNDNSENATIVVLNALGQKVFETKNTGNLTQVSLPNGQSGVYYVRVNKSSGTSVQKVIIE